MALGRMRRTFVTTSSRSPIVGGGGERDLFGLSSREKFKVWIIYLHELMQDTVNFDCYFGLSLANLRYIKCEVY